MVRRATLERGQPIAAGDEALPGLPAAPRGPDHPARQRPAAPRRGAGGRWLIWLGRGVAWAVLLLIGYRGVAAIVTGPPQPTTPPSTAAATADGGFPATLAEAYALQFATVYLNYSPATATKRSNALAAFLPSGTDSQLGWNGAGSQDLQSEQVASITVQNAHQAIITLLAQVNGRLLELGVPVYSSGGGLVISGEPAFLPAPARVSPPQSSAIATTDTTAQSQLQNQLPAFFRAFASGDSTLSRFLAPGAQVTGLERAVAFGSISQLTVPSGGPTRHITAVVVWRVPSAQPAKASTPVAATHADLEMAYEMTVIRRGGTWYVESVGASGQLPGPP
jgi:hypothetical protein